MRIASFFAASCVLLVLSGCPDSPTGGDDAGGSTNEAMGSPDGSSRESPANSEPDAEDPGLLGEGEATQREDMDAGTDIVPSEGADDAGGPLAVDGSVPSEPDAEADGAAAATAQASDGAVQWVTPVRSPEADTTMNVEVRRDGVVIVGVNRFLSTSADIAERPPYVVGLSADGREVFRFAFTLTGSSYFGYVPHVDLGDGSLRVYGYFDGSVQLGPDESSALSAEPGKESAFIASYDARGQFQWARTLSQPGGRPAVDALRVLDSGDLVIAGSFAGTGALHIGSRTIPYASSRKTGAARASHYVVRVDRSGNVTKAASFAGVCDYANGLSRVADVLATADREIVLVAGGFDCEYSADTYGPDEKTVQGQAAALVFGAGPAWDAATVAPGFFYRGGAERLPSGEWVARGQSNVDETWRFDGAGSFVHRRPGTPVGQLADGTLVTTAGFSGSVSVSGSVTLASSQPVTRYVAGYDLRGALLWARKLASYDSQAQGSPEVIVDATGETTLTGPCPSAFADESAAPSGDYCITRLDADGAMVWHRTTRGVSNASALVTDQGKVWVQLASATGARWQRSADQFQDSGPGVYVARYGREGSLELLLRSNVGPVFAPPLVATPDRGVLLARQLSSTPYVLFPGDPAESQLALAPGDSGDGVLAKLRP